MSVEQILAELEQYPHGIGEKYAGRLREEVERSFEKWQAERQPKPALDIEDEEEEPEEPTHWDTVDKNGKPTPTCTNARRALMALNIICRYDVFHDRFCVEGKIIKGDAGTNLDHTVLDLARPRSTRRSASIPAPRTRNDALVALCLTNKFDPVLDYLNALQWDGTPRLDRWLITYAGAEDTPLNREFSRIALIAAVRRVRRPGIKFDPIIVLEGPMGTNKSKTIEIAGRRRELQRSVDLRRARSGAAGATCRHLAL